jgi:hypothetical protein
MGKNDGADSLVRSDSLLDEFAGYVLTCRRVNQQAWMKGLAERLTKVSAALGETDVYEYNGDFIVKANAEAHVSARSENDGR